MRNQLNIINIFFFTILALVLFSESVHSAVIKLKTGNSVKGEVIEETEHYIKIDFYGTPLTFFFEDIESIDADDEKLASPEKEAYSYFKKGIEYALEGRFKEAEEELKKSLEIKFDFGCQNVYKLIKDLNKGDIEEKYALIMLKGANSIINQEYQQGIIEFQKALEICTDCSYVYLGLGFIYLSLQDCEKANENFLKAKELYQSKNDYEVIQKINEFMKQCSNN